MGLLNIYKGIQEELDRGASRIDIFNKFSAKTPADAPKFAYMLASIPYPEARKKFIVANAVLFLMLLALPVLTVMAEWPIDLKESTLFLTISLFVPLIFSYFVFHFHGGIYRLLGLWCGIDLLESILVLGFATPAGLGKTALLFCIVVLSFVIGKKVFPNLRFLGPRVDGQGNYMV